MDIDSKDQQMLYSNKLFFYAVLPVLKTIVEDTPSLTKKWQGKNSVHQVSCLLNQSGESEKESLHYVVSDGVWSVHKGGYDGKPNSELIFKSRAHMNDFFKGKIFPLPKGLFSNFSFLLALLRMSALLSATKPPKKLSDQILLTKCLYYLLPAGISTLNKLGHKKIRAWSQKSPDRIYAWRLSGHPDVASFIRVKAGNTRSGRGEYKRSIPFFTMSFDSPRSALGILLEIDDMIESTVQGKLMMMGGPEFGAQIGDFMLMVGALIKP